MMAYNGTEKVSHHKEKVTDMIHRAETLYGCSLASSYEGKKMPSGTYFIDPVLANASKIHEGKEMAEATRLMIDVAGGFVADLPSDRDFENPAVGPLLKKYLKGGKPGSRRKPRQDVPPDREDGYGKRRHHFRHPRGAAPRRHTGSRSSGSRTTNPRSKRPRGWQASRNDIPILQWRAVVPPSLRHPAFAHAPGDPRRRPKIPAGRRQTSCGRG